MGKVFIRHEVPAAGQYTCSRITAALVLSKCNEPSCETNPVRLSNFALDIAYKVNADQLCDKAMSVYRQLGYDECIVDASPVSFAHFFLEQMVITKKRTSDDSPVIIDIRNGCCPTQDTKMHSIDVL